MPYMHSESSAIHKLAVPLFKEHTDDLSYEFELKHQAIIERFGYYPHRNCGALNRNSTPEEIEFLKDPNNFFGIGKRGVRNNLAPLLLTNNCGVNVLKKADPIATLSWLLPKHNMIHLGFSPQCY